MTSQESSTQEEVTQRVTLKRSALQAHESQLQAPFPGYGPVLPEHVLDLFADGLEPFFIPGDEDGQ